MTLNRLTLVRCALTVSSLAVIAACGGGGYGSGYDSPPPPPNKALSRGANSSGPIQLSADDRTLWVANPETNTVSATYVYGDAKTPMAEIAVGAEPRNLAVSPDGQYVFVANAGGNTLTVISTGTLKAVGTVNVGTEPYGLAFTPSGKKLYVANARSNTVSVVDPVAMRVVTTISGVGQEPRGVAVTNNGDNRDDDEKVYVTQFQGVDRAGVFDGSIKIGADDYKEGHVAVISTANDAVLKQAVLNPMADTGFRSNGSTLKKLAPKFTADTPPAPIFDVVTGAFPNMLQAIAIKGTHAYLPNTCASPDGPVRFNVNVQSCLSVLDTTTDAEGLAAGLPQTLNMNRGINFEVGDAADERKRLFLAVPWAVAFKNKSDEGYAVSLSSNVVVKVVLDANGTPTINAPKAKDDPGAIVRIMVGQGPRGIVINSTDSRAFVANENSRDVSVIDLAKNEVIATFATAALPARDSDAARRLIGKATFESSTGLALPGLSTQALVPRFPAKLSHEGWGSCVACHGFGRTDNVVWMFGTGPRRSSPLNWTFNPKDPTDIKALNHSAINDEVQDFQNNMLDVSGGSESFDANKNPIGGLIVDATTGFTAGGAAGAGAGGSKPPLVVKNAGRSFELDALAFYVATGIKTPSSPLAGEPGSTAVGQQIAHGRSLFAEANCASCHGGPGWASGRMNRIVGTPVLATDAGASVLRDILRNVGTFDVTAFNELKQNGSTAAGALGFNPPSLLGAFAMGPYLHNGSAQTLSDVMQLKPHRTRGLLIGQPDPFETDSNRADIVKFLESIDTTTAPFDITP